MKDKITGPIRRGFEALQAKFPVNRLVTILTPLAFAPAAAAITGWAALHAPGVHVDPETLTALMGAGALAAGGLAYKWLDGWQKNETRQHEVGQAELDRASQERVAALATTAPGIKDARAAAAAKVVEDTAPPTV